MPISLVENDYDTIVAKDNFFIILNVEIVNMKK